MSEDTSSLSDDEIPVLVNLDLCPGNNDLKVEQTQELHRQEPKAPVPVVPVTILTGFLGSGKTTLIQYILRSPDHGKKIAVIENEFSGAGAAPSNSNGALPVVDPEKEGLSIETLIARDGTNDANLTDLIELPNGCICCTVKDSLVETLELLLKKKQARELDYIIIECSGMANPGPIASIFWLDEDGNTGAQNNLTEEGSNRLRLDGIVACVDSRNLEMQLRETSSRGAPHGVGIGEGGGDEAAQQIAFADRIIVNKIDLLEMTDVDGTVSMSGKGQEGKNGHTNSNPKLKRVLSQIRAINCTAPIRQTTFSQIPDLDWILDTKCFDPDKDHVFDTDFIAYPYIVEENCNDLNCRTCRIGDVPNNVTLSSMQYCAPLGSPLEPHSPPSHSKKHKHTNAIRTIALIEKGSVSLQKIHSWLASILWPDQDESDGILKAQLHELERIGQITTPELVERRKREEIDVKMLIFRVKGVVSVYHPKNEFDSYNDDVCVSQQQHNDSDLLDGRKFIVQAVNDLWDINPASEAQGWKDGETRVCKVVIIGRNLDFEALELGFKACLENDNYHQPLD